MNASEFTHPDDATALKTLEAIPVLPIVVKKVMDIGIEQLTYGTNMASKVLLSPTQLPKLYNVLPPICQRLGIREPGFYLEMNPMPNAYAFGDTYTAITITSGLVEMLTEDELTAVVAHECGHILCRHMLYHTVAAIMANEMMQSEILGVLAAPVRYALLYWNRKSELSCDRVAAFHSGPKSIISAALRRLPTRLTLLNSLNKLTSMMLLARTGHGMGFFRPMPSWGMTILLLPFVFAKRCVGWPAINTKNYVRNILLVPDATARLRVGQCFVNIVVRNFKS